MQPARVSDRLQPLLRLGEPNSDDHGKNSDGSCWLDYGSMGLSASDAPGLIALATDKVLNCADPPACYAPVHAWRALGQMKCEAAIVPLVDLLDELATSDDDWGLQDLPQVLTMLAPASLPELDRFVRDQRRNLWARAAAGRAMTQIAKRCQASRDPVVRILTDQLSQPGTNDPGLNGLIVAMLIELRAIESEGAIRRAYDAGEVEEKVCGPLKGVIADLGAANQGSGSAARKA